MSGESGVVPVETRLREEKLKVYNSTGLPTLGEPSAKLALIEEIPVLVVTAFRRSKLQRLDIFPAHNS